MLLTAGPDGAERLLIDPAAIDPLGLDDARRMVPLARRAGCWPT